MDEKIRTYLSRVCTRDLYHQPNILQRQLLPIRHWEKVSRREREEKKERKKESEKEKKKGGGERKKERERKPE